MPLQSILSRFCGVWHAQERSPNWLIPADSRRQAWWDDSVEYVRAAIAINRHPRSCEASSPQHPASTETEYGTRATQWSIAWTT